MQNTFRTSLLAQATSAVASGTGIRRVVRDGQAHLLVAVSLDSVVRLSADAVGAMVFCLAEIDPNSAARVVDEFFV
jgi:hypothetical protein